VITSDGTFDFLRETVAGYDGAPAGKRGGG
jgi:hypothetical protein